MRGIALALGGPSDAFDGEIAGDSFWAMRLIGYPGSYDATSLLTLINQDDNVDALQVRNKSGEWIWVVPIPGTFVCNIGDMLKPNYNTTVEPLEFCKLKTGGVGSFQGVIYGKHLVHKVKANFGL
ncbi:Gibberellin 2-beta-dioxygenase 4 [Dendrobium catenatum]|uniref:Gibberellin 2-beta-dioxygenase 4 n=1 Tax=Dendrobium catenatum TaxID=906689 RepID=A0A2I0VEK3_9ASPA|nr:Gibberellin 2-beta-dioxygenase 4 [Dendrobium catenatum]